MRDIVAPIHVFHAAEVALGNKKPADAVSVVAVFVSIGEIVAHHRKFAPAPKCNHGLAISRHAKAIVGHEYLAAIAVERSILDQLGAVDIKARCVVRFESRCAPSLQPHGLQAQVLDAGYPQQRV